MVNLTRQEKIVLLFVSSVVFIGISISYIAKHSPRFKNYFSDISSEENDIKKINLVKASQDELIALPGIGPELASRIIEYRQTRGGFKTIEDIKKVKGLGNRKFELLKDSIIVEENPH